MGWRPWEVRRATIAEFRAAYEGFKAFHGGGEDGSAPLSRAELDDLKARYPDGHRA